MDKCIWRNTLIAKRRRDLYADFQRLARHERNMSSIVAKLCDKYGISLATVYSDLRSQGGFGNGKRPAERLAKR